MTAKTDNSSAEALCEKVLAALADLKAVDPVRLEVSELTSVMDWMIVASGTSRRHIRALAEKVIDALREAGHRPSGVEGDEMTGWILVDYGDVVVHLMSEEARLFYELEKFWTMRPDKSPG